MWNCETLDQRDDDSRYASNDINLLGSYHRWLPGANNLMPLTMDMYD